MGQNKNLICKSVYFFILAGNYFIKLHANKFKDANFVR